MTEEEYKAFHGNNSGPYETRLNDFTFEEVVAFLQKKNYTLVNVKYTYTSYRNDQKCDEIGRKTIATMFFRDYPLDILISEEEARELDYVNVFRTTIKQAILSLW